MNTYLYDFSYLFINIFEAYIVFYFMGIFLGKENINKRSAIIVYASYYLITSTIYLFFAYFILNIVSSILALFIVTLAYKSKISKKIISVSIMYLTAFVSEAIVAFIIGITGSSDYVFRREHYGDILTLVLAVVIKFALVKIIGRFKHIGESPAVSWQFIVTSIIISVISVYFEINIFMINDLNNATYIASIICILSMNFVVLYLYDSISNAFSKKNQLELSQQQIEYYHKQAELIQHNYENTQQLRHDLKNNTIALSEFIKQDKKEKALDYINSISGMLKPIKQYSSTGIIEVDSLINYKLADAEENNIKITSEIAIPSDIELQSKDFVTILGNLLDNAIEATKKVKDKYINLNMQYDKGIIFIKIKNSFNGELIKSGNSYKTTKNNNQESHGIGLKSITTAVQKYNGEFTTEYDDKEFVATVLLMT